MKKRLIFIVSLILILVLIVIVVFKNNNFDRLRLERERVATLIKNEELKVKPNGLVELPKELKKLSDSGECLVFNYSGSTGIMFWTYRGIIDSSKGYFYITDEISYEDYINLDVYTASIDFTTIKEIDNNWYSVSTG